MDKAREALDVVSKQLKELREIRQTEKDDSLGAYTRFGRWKSRTVELLEIKINAKESRSFKEVNIGGDLHKDASRYESFLQALYDELKNSPDSFTLPKEVNTNNYFDHTSHTVSAQREDLRTWSVSNDLLTLIGKLVVGDGEYGQFRGSEGADLFDKAGWQVTAPCPTTGWETWVSEQLGLWLQLDPEGAVKLLATMAGPDEFLEKGRVNETKREQQVYTWNSLISRYGLRIVTAKSDSAYVERITPGRSGIAPAVNADRVEGRAITAPRQKFQIFISSTFTDLREEREAVHWQILTLRHIPAGMENFTATNERGWRTIQRVIDMSDYYIIIVAGRYGSIEPEWDQSWTHHEYEYAASQGIPILPFIREMNAINGDQVDQDRSRLNSFIEQLKRKHLCKTWRHKDDLAREVSAALTNQINDDREDGALRPGWFRGDALPDTTPELTAKIARLTSENRKLRSGQVGQIGILEGRPTLAELEQRYIDLVLEEEQGNKKRTAQILEIDRRTLYRILERNSPSESR